MQDAVSLNISPLQAILALVFQAWLIIFPIIIIRKLNRLTSLLEDRAGDGAGNSDSGNEEA